LEDNIEMDVTETRHKGVDFIDNIILIIIKVLVP
jgi:hypothetical protein